MTLLTNIIFNDQFGTDEVAGTRIWKKKQVHMKY
jgi:hypothetical protein